MEASLKNKNCIHLKCTMWCFDIHIPCEMITTTKLINMFITSLLCGVGEHKVNSLSQFPIYSPVLLALVVMLYIRAPELILRN